MARLAREEQLANQQVQLANGKRLRLVDLQGTSRVVLAAGTTQQVGHNKAGRRQTGASAPPCRCRHM